MLLADMIDHLPLENEGSAEEVKVTSRPWLISSSQVHLIGQRLVDSLLGLKHMGAISSAGQAFSIICRRLMRIRPTSRPESKLAIDSEAPASSQSTTILKLIGYPAK